MVGIILEGYRLCTDNEVRSEFFLIKNPFDTDRVRLSKAEARKYIIENCLHVAIEDKSGRIWDTATQDFRRSFSVSESGLNGEERKRYREKLYRTIEKVWGI